MMELTPVNGFAQCLTRFVSVLQIRSAQEVHVVPALSTIVFSVRGTTLNHVMCVIISIQ